MSKKAAKRAALVRTLATHVLEEGLADTGLRRLAEVAGTSDRMLLYYFENKEDLLTAVLLHIANGLAEALHTAFGTTPLAPVDLLDRLWETMKSEAFAAQLRLWLDLSSQASRGHPLFGPIVNQIGTGWIAWLASMLDVAEEDKVALATLMLSTLDGQLVLFPKDPAQGDSAIQLLRAMLTQRHESA